MKRMAIGLGVLTVLVLAGPVRAELCEKCKGKMYIMSVGKCVECGGFTGSKAHKLCRKCSAKLGQCEHCRGPLKGAKSVPVKPIQVKPVPIKPAPKPAKIDTKKDGTYTSGKWKYEYTVRAGGKPRKPREWRTGLLTYDGKPLAGAKMWDRIKTPWGTMQYYQPYHRKSYFQNSYLRRWMLEMPGGGRINPAKGWLLPSPALHYLRALELDASAGGKTVSAFVGQRIVIRLKTDGHHRWGLGKVQGDAIKQVGGAEYIRGPGVEVGHFGPGKFAFTFGAVKPGTAKLTLGYSRPKVVPTGPRRGEGTVRGPANKTFTLTVTVKAAPVKPEPKPEKINWKNPGTYTSGKWKYDYTIIVSHPHKRGGTERIGSLFYNGKPIAGTKMLDRIKTPWGLMQYLGRKKRQLNQGWMSARNSKGRLLPSPEKGKSAPAYLRALELDESSNGKTVSAFVGQKIIIRLKGAPVPGLMWNPAKLEGDAIEQAGQMKFVPDARPRPVFVPGPGHQRPGPVPAPGARPQPMPGKGLVAHTTGGPGKYVFTFRAVKAGKAEVTIKSRVPRAGRPNRTFALTVNVKANLTAERVKKLKAGLDEKDFELVLRYRGLKADQAYPSLGLVWSVRKVRALAGGIGVGLGAPAADKPNPNVMRMGKITYVRIAKKEDIVKIIDHLAKDGFLCRALGVKTDPPGGPLYTLEVNSGKMRLHEYLGWDLKMLKRLDGLRKVLDGDAAKEMDKLLKRLEPQRKKWQKTAGAPKPAKIDTKKSGKYTSGKWKYQYSIGAIGTRSERRFSGLTYDGNLIAGAKMFDRIKTPWGMMQYYQMSYVRGWMLELTGGTPINPKKGRLLPSPEKAASSGLAPLELDASSNGKTVSATVGQEIVIRLKGNATTGYSWVVGKIDGDALGKVGLVKYVSDQPPAPAGGRGRGLMMHRVGGGGKYVFTFTAKKTGKAKLTLEYKRGWEKGKPPAKTFTLTVSVKPDLTAGRVKKLKANIDSFKFALDYHDPQGKPLCRGFILSVPRVKVETVMGFDHVTISKKQAEKIIDYLATNGVLGASGLVDDDVSLPVGPAPAYDAIMQRNREGMTLFKDPGWGPGMLKRLDGMLKRLDGLRKVLDDDAAKAVDKLLKQLEPQRKKWQKPAAKPDPTAKRTKKQKAIIIIYTHVALPRPEK